MTPFPTDDIRCLKCDADEVDCKYSKGMQGKEEIEYLEWECVFCGYKLSTECADAEETK